MEDKILACKVAALNLRQAEKAHALASETIQMTFDALLKARGDLELAKEHLLNAACEGDS